MITTTDKKKRGISHINSRGNFNASVCYYDTGLFMPALTFCTGRSILTISVSFVLFHSSRESCAGLILMNGFCQKSSYPWLDADGPVKNEYCQQTSSLSVVKVQQGLDFLISGQKIPPSLLFQHQITYCPDEFLHCAAAQINMLMYEWFLAVWRMVQNLNKHFESRLGQTAGIYRAQKY